MIHVLSLCRQDQHPPAILTLPDLNRNGCLAAWVNDYNVPQHGSLAGRMGAFHYPGCNLAAQGAEIARSDLGDFLVDLRGDRDVFVDFGHTCLALLLVQIVRLCVQSSTVIINRQWFIDN